VEGVPLNIARTRVWHPCSASRLALSSTKRIIFLLARRVAMRLRTLINRLVWLVVIAFLGYAALLGVSSYLQVKETVEQAVADSVQRQKAALATGRPTAPPQDQAVDVRDAILLIARRANLPVGVTKVDVKPEGNRLRVSLHWACVVLTVADEVVLAVPLWMDRTFDLRP
jgi:hypothetical protein